MPIEEQIINNTADEITACINEIGKRIIGQRDMIEGVLMGVLAKGHVLLEGVPGLAKTQIVKTMADIMDANYKRIQFTPDLLPADLIGTLVYQQSSGTFFARKGPIFSHILLADEINRAPAKVQSALLEAMQERQVTIGDETYRLEPPFFVLATQNPIEQEGTYHLPEAQLDRFIMKLLIDYPAPEEEVNILRLVGTEKEIRVNKILNREKLQNITHVAEGISMDSRIEEYIVSIVAASRLNNRRKADFVRFIEFGASPRASIHLYRCAKIKALFNRRNFVLPEDVKDVAYNVLRHRIILTYEAESEELTPDNIIAQILDFVHVP